MDYHNAFGRHHDTTVLLVDDNAQHRLLAREVLSPANYTIIEAENGRQALDILRQQPVDLVLLDKQMPLLSGPEVCREVRADHHLKMLPIIMMTGCDNDLPASFEAGASDFIHKPYKASELLARTSAALKSKRLIDQLDCAEEMLFALAKMVEAKDEDTGDHCERIAYAAVAFGKELGLPPKDLDALRKGGVLHDIGKLGIPDAILLKNGPLDKEEWKRMQLHPSIGAKLCEGLKSVRHVLPIIKFHHERWDGTGYPYGLKGEQIPRLVRIFQLIDIFDALAHARPYKAALPMEKVISIFEEEIEKGWRDPEITQQFIDLLRNRPEMFFRPEAKQKNNSPLPTAYEVVKA